MDTFPENSPSQEPERTGLLDALLDFSFSKAITPMIIKPLFFLGLATSAIVALGWIFDAFTRHGIMAGMMSLIFAPLVFVIYALVTRVFLEIVVVLFRIGDHLKNIDNKTR